MAPTAPAPARLENRPAATPATGGSGWRAAVSAVGRRWPTWFAVALATVSLWDVDDGREYAFLLVLAATGYLFVAVVDRPRTTWPGLFAFTGAVVVFRVADLDPMPAMALVAVALVAVGLLAGQLRRPGLPALQSPAAFGFIALAVVALSVPAEVGGFLVAAGLLGHAAWDFLHWRANRIVVRSFAEWCGVLDAILGAGILLLLLR
ncbi:hypothetical protein O7627_04920 [Solwaraspora sp. WMMD1047]|uniref:hypothetical protein n=1 Tax=Solwaraspora sp. WMMD1047 TaxID=3016102 RepID=UPI00241620C3|nr:hypothetical protein [Solwaraspora sp. WMMD1047]MDG4828647.1 hypothetical protein [Solwaraspora sp. WMMD1047]